MEKFEFGTNIIDKVLNELDKARKYIKIVVFQIHNEDIINKLIEKAKKGISVEIITLPYESIYDNTQNAQEHIIGKLNELENAGANIYICNWNLGDTSHTKTVPGPWHNLHLKFIVTDKMAMALSANLISNEDIDAMFIRNDRRDTEEFNKKFESIKSDYIDNNVIDKIKEKITDKDILKEILTPPEHLDKNQKSILHYPIDLCPDMIEIEEKLYIFPFDCRGRDFIKKIIDDAQEYVYLSTERFTDKEMFYFLQKSKFKGKEIKVLTKFQSQDYQYDIIQFAKNCLSTGIILKDNKLVHAKLIITDKLVALGSINLNQMNLGFIPKKGFWRSNTEAMIICKNKEIINRAKSLFLGIFNNSKDIINNLIKKEVDNFKKIAKEVLGMPLYNCGEYLAEKYLKDETRDRKKCLDILIEAGKLAKAKNLKKINEDLIRAAENNLMYQKKL